MVRVLALYHNGPSHAYGALDTRLSRFFFVDKRLSIILYFLLVVEAVAKAAFLILIEVTSKSAYR